MSNLVCTLEEQASPVGEIELTNEQLVAIFGANGHHSSSKSNFPHNKSSSVSRSCHKSTNVSCSSNRHVVVNDIFHECFKFSFELSIKVDEKEEIDEDWNNCDF
jgi:hypothetical protein